LEQEVQVQELHQLMEQFQVLIHLLLQVELRTLQKVVDTEQVVMLIMALLEVQVVEVLKQQHRVVDKEELETLHQ
tara:strand:+ start:117 stop:341 length:225 start_codon:yes stop_codon:yes gene_type:complete